MRKIYLALLTVMFAAITQAQVNNYTFSQSVSALVPITGGTVIVVATIALPSGLDSATMDDFTYAEYALPFPFWFGSEFQNSFRVNSNGWLGFGPGVNTNSTAPISSTLAFNGIISPFGADLMGLSTSTGTVTSGSNTITAVANTSMMFVGAIINGTGIPVGTTVIAFDATTITLSANATSNATNTFLSWTTGEIRFETIGTAPNRTFVVQFVGLSQYSTGTTSAGLHSTINFQIRLEEAGGVAANQSVSIVYGPSQHPGTNQTGQVGLRGMVNSDFNNRTTTNNWSATTAGATNTASVTWGAASVPAPGLTFTWTPPPACIVPPDQPSALLLTPTAGSVSGTFTAAPSVPTGYLVVQTTSATPPTAPVNGTSYVPGANALGGTIISSGPATTFNSPGLASSTTYYYWVYSFNNTICTGGPIYNSVAPLTATVSTLACTITGTKTVGPTGDYATLTAAIADITLNGLAGPVILELQAAYTSGGETFPVTITKLPCEINGLTIRPQAGAVGRIITSADPVATIDLNGASYVTIDGRPGGTGVASELTISNTALSTSSVIRFINDATMNNVMHSSILGSTATTNGVVLFSGGLVTGNDFNTISNNTISSAGANLPLNGVISLGTSVAINNSNNTLMNNNISNIFSAGSVFNGINIGTGNSNWTISDNRIFQTAPRAVTTANTVTGIAVTSGEGHTISGNVIGFANAAGTGVTAYTSTVAFRYIGINGTFTAGGALNTIQNNTVAGITMTTSSGATTTNGILAGINVTAGNVNIAGNTIGANTGTGSLTATSTTSGGLLVGINASSTGEISITNNTLGALTSSGTTATVAGSVTGINVSGGAASMLITGNTIGNSTPNNIRGGTLGLTTGSSLVSGVHVPSTLPNLVTISNNTIQNLSSYGSGTAGFVRGIWTTSSTTSVAPYTITGNTINNLTTNGALTTITNGQAAVAGIVLGLGNNSLISQNTIHTLSNFNNTTIGNFAAGILHANATNTTISRNRIYNISNAGTSTTVTTPSIAAGIINRSGTTKTTIVNNMISLGNGQTTNTAFIGIQLQHGSTPNPLNNVWFNSVNIEGTAASGAQPSFGIARVDFSTTARTAGVNILNNIITNSRSGGTGSHYAIGNNFGAAAASTTGWGANASDFNVLNASPSTIGWWNGPQTFEGWQTASNGDRNSFSNIPVVFVNTATGDLHLNMGTTPTQLESSATPIPGITIDYDNQTRPGPPGSVNGGGLGPDMGADEFDGVVLDLTPPLISYLPITNTLCPTANPTLSVTITDISGVNTAPGTRPRVYYKKTTNANVLPATNDNTTDGWKFVEATNTSSPFNFTIELNRIFGGVAPGDVFQYFVVAQDMAATPNVGINSGTFNSTPSSVALTAGNFPITGTINSYTIVIGGLSGTVTIGAAGTYPTLTGTGGLFEAINTSGLTGNLVADILDATITETGVNPLNQMIYACGGPFNLLIKPASGVTSTLTGSFASNPLVRILSSNVTIDGSNNGSTSRDLTITNTSTTSPSVLLIGSTGPVPVTNTTLKNSTIINGATSASAVVVSDAALGSAGYFNNITIQNNSVQRAYIGVYSIAVPMTGNGSGLLITGNELNQATPNHIRLTALYVQGVDGAMVTNNTIGNMTSSDASNVGGIWLASSTINSTVSGNTINSIATTSGAPRGIVISSGVSPANVNVRNNTITGLTTTSTGTTTGIYVLDTTSHVNIEKNQVSNIRNTSASGFGANGIQLASTLTGANINVNNNFISDITGDGFNATDITDNGYGIIVVSGAGYNIDHNTVLMNTNQNDPVSLPGAINIQDGVTAAGAVNIRNNIFVSTQTTGDNRYAIISESPNTVFGVIDHNNYYTAGPNLGRIQGVNVVDLAALQVAFGGNTNSVNSLPVFVSATDLHLSNAPGANWCMDGTGTPLPSVPTDIDNDIRSTGTPPNGPDMGADEFSSTGLVITNPGPICPGSTTDITLPAITAGSVGGLTFTYFTDAAATIPVGTPTAVGAGTYYIKATSGTCSKIMPVVVSLLAPPTAFTVTGGGGYCPGGTGVVVGLNNSESGVNYQLQINAANTGTPVAGTGGAISFGLQTTLGTYTVIGTSTVTGCSGPMSNSVTVFNHPVPVVTGVMTQPTTCTSNDGAINITVSGAAGPFTYSWTTVGGSGIVAGAEDQSTLSVGLYTVMVTDQLTGCQQSATFDLVGPGGCSVCPTMGALVTVPAPGVCANAPVSITASGLTDMGVTYGITFKFSTTALADPYTGGTTIATVNNAGLTGGGSTATTSTTFPTSGNYIIYAILSPTPANPACRPSMQTNLTVVPIPTVNAVSNQSVCNGSSTSAVTFSGAEAGTVYNWTNNTTSIGLAGTGSGNIPAFTAINTGSTPVTATITVTPSLTNAGATCTGTPTTFTITVHPTPIVNPVTNQTVCNGSSTTAVTFSGTAGAVFNWTNNTPSIGLAASGTGNIPAFTATNTGTVPVIATITVTPSTTGSTPCTGPATTFTITVNPTPTVNAVTNQTICTGSNTVPVVFSGAPAGTVFNWTNNNTAIGLGASGTGDIPSFVVTNTTGAPISGTVTVTPSYTNGGVTCTGTATTFTITVTPIPVVNAVSNQSVCAGASVAAITFGSNVPGATFNWTNTNTSIGLAATGTGNIPAFTAVNTGTAPVSANISVTAVSGSCVGAPLTFVITVNPVPTVNVIANQVVCAGATQPAVTLAGTVPNTVFGWTNNTTSIGLAASGTGNVPAFVAVNTGTTPVVATITVTPRFTVGTVTCTGTARTFTITVNPRPTVSATALTNRICLSDPMIPLSGLPVGGSWSGVGVSGFNFVPASTAVGTYNLTYSFVSAQGCTGSATITAKVEECPERMRLLGDDALTIFPNPNNGRFNVRINSTLYNYLGFKVYDMKGSLVNGIMNNGVLTSPVLGGLTFGRVIPIDLSYLPAGTYIVKFYYDAAGARTTEKGFKVVIAGH